MKAESGPLELQTSPKLPTTSPSIARGTRQFESTGRACEMLLTWPWARRPATWRVSIEKGNPVQGGCHTLNGGGWSVMKSDGKERSSSGHRPARCASLEAKPGFE